MAYFGVRCSDDGIKVSLAGAVRVHVQIVECAAAVTLSAPYRLSVPDGAAHPALRFPRVINEQQHVVHGLTATFSEPDTNPETTLVYMDSTKVDAQAQTALTVEPDADPHVYTLPLGVVRGSGERNVSVTLNYSCELQAEGRGTVRLWMPDLALPGQAAKLDFTAQIRSDYTVEKVESGIAQFQVWTFDNGITDVSLVNADDAGTDIDMAITYKDMELLPALSLEKPDEHAAADSGWNSKTLAMLTITPDLQDATRSMGGRLGEYIFVVDRSGSMSGEKIGHAKETLLLFLKSLPVGCFFNVVGFGSNYTALFSGGSVQYSGATLETAMKYQKNMTSNLGGTDLLRPLENIFRFWPAVKGYARHIFVLTDGAIFNTDTTVNLVKENAKKARLHAFGIGANADKALVRRLAEAGGGVHDFVEAFDRTMESKVMDALRDAMIACATNLSVTWKLPKGVTATPVSDGSLKRPLADGEHRVVFYEITGDVNGGHSKSSVNVSYEVDGVKQNHSVPFSLDKATTRVVKLIHRMAAVERLRDLQRNGQTAELTALCEEMNLDDPDHMTITCCETATNQLVSYIKEKAPPAAAEVPAAAPAPVFGVLGAGRPLGTSRRHRPVLRDNVYGALPKSTVKRLMHRGGVVRMSSLVPEEIRARFKAFLSNIIKDAVTYAENGRRRTVTGEDMDAALKKNGVNLYGIEDRSLYRFEGGTERRPARRRTWTYRSTPLGRPDATTSTVASVLGVTAPPPRPALAKQRTKDISEVPSNLARSASSSRSLRKRTSDASSGRDETTPTKQRSFSRKGSSASSAPSRQASLTKRPSLRKSVSGASGASAAAAGGVVSPALARQDSGVSTTASQPVSMTLTMAPSRRTPSLKRKSTSNAAVSMKIKSNTDDAATKAKLAKKETKKVTKVTAAKKKKAAAVSTALSRTRKQRSSLAGPSGGAAEKPDFTDMINLITLQTFDGSWDLSKTLASVLRKTTDALTQSVPDPRLSLKVWATALSLAWLDKHFSQARTEYEMIHVKGTKWVTSQELHGTGLEQLLKDATKQV